VGMMLYKGGGNGFGSYIRPWREMRTRSAEKGQGNLPQRGQCQLLTDRKKWPGKMALRWGKDEKKVDYSVKEEVCEEGGTHNDFWCG